MGQEFDPEIVPMRVAIPPENVPAGGTAGAPAGAEKRVLPGAAAALTHIRADGEVAEWLKAAVC